MSRAKRASRDQGPCASHAPTSPCWRHGCACERGRCTCRERLGVRWIRRRRPGGRPSILCAALANPVRVRSTRRRPGDLSRGTYRRRSAAGRSAHHEQLADEPRRCAVARDARGAVGQRGGSLHLVLQAQRADVETPHRTKTHRQRIGHRGTVLRAAPRRTSIRTPTWPRPRST